jgi:DUF971 family protein
LRVDKARRTLSVAFDTGAHYALPAEYLRVESPSADVQGHGSGQKRIEAGKQGVKIETLESVGNYAVRIRFDDGHDTGLYSWDYLHELGAGHDEKWRAYLAALAQLGLSR